MNSQRASLQHQFEQDVSALVEPGAKVCVGLSGGLDSVVLLQLFHGAIGTLRAGLSAVHVHHGLSPNANDWTAFCEALCARLEIPLEVARVSVDRESGLGLEAAAREARHAVYAQVDADCIALAHHADDAAETLLLRLLRGTGIKGLAGMSAVRTIDARRRIVRPLLRWRRADLEAFAREHGLQWVEDESNEDRSLDRNYVRHEILARLEGRFPGFPHTLLRASEHAATAQQLLDELAAQDLGETGVGMALATLRRLTPPRAGNAVRWYLASRGAQQPDTASLEEIVRQIQACGADSHLGLAVGGHVLRRHRDRVVLVAGDDAPPLPFAHLWAGEQSLPVPELDGRVEFVAASGRGISVARTREKGWVVRSRTGGETMKAHPSGPSRSLKNLFQEDGVPEWERQRQPLLAHGDKLVWVPALGIDADYRAGSGEEGLEPRWITTQPVDNPRR
jgi:tRNA(Ile)-lysidine synthase